MSDQLYSIGEVVKITGFTYRTVRYYGELKLVNPIMSEKGHKRHYTKDDVNKFLFIKRLKDLGLPLDHIKDALNLKADFRKKKYPAKTLAPYIVDMLDEQLKIAQEKAEKYTKLSCLLGEMLNMAKEECLNCNKDICEGYCFSKKFMKDSEIIDK